LARMLHLRSLPDHVIACVPRCADLRSENADHFVEGVAVCKHRPEWREKSYRVELTVTQELADAAIGGVLYYFCHIHSKMSGKIRLKNVDGTAAAGTGEEELDLYPRKVPSNTDATCGTYGLGEFADGGSSECAERFLCGSIDSTFEQCLQAMDCQMNKEMRVGGFDDHGDHVATFCQQMIPHHINAVNMAKLTLKTVADAVLEAAMDEGGLNDLLHGIINGQNFQIHQMNAYLGAHEDDAVTVEFGPKCTADSGSSATPSVIVGSSFSSGTNTFSNGATNASVCDGSEDADTICLATRVNLFASDTGYYEFEGVDGVQPDLEVTVGQTLVFEQYDHTNWYHPLGFAYYPDGAHGEDWGGNERDEVEGLDQLRYFVEGAEACGSDDLGLDCYEPEFFYPRPDWRAKKYRVELTVTQELADAAIGGVLYYFCHIHSKMSGKIRIKNVDGTAAAGTGEEELELYPRKVPSNTDATCGTYGLGEFADGGSSECAEWLR
jgi:plastocyanin